MLAPKQSRNYAWTAPVLADQYDAARRAAEAENSLVRQSGRFSLVSGGDINTYAVFAEAAIDAISHTGRVGVVIPSAITATLAYQPYVSLLVESGRLASYYDFENRKSFFPEVDSRYRFCLFTVRGQSGPAASCGFMLHTLGDVTDESRTFPLRESDLSLLNPNTASRPLYFNLAMTLVSFVTFTIAFPSWYMMSRNAIPGELTFTE